MRGAGIEARSFLKVRFPLFTSKVNYRNHRKIVVIDGRVAYMGGMNIALRYMKGFPWGIWRDTHIKIEGKAVYGLQTAFLTDWYVVDRTLITSSRYFPEVGIFGKALIQIVTSDPVGEWRDIMQGLLIAISSSRKYFYIQTPLSVAYRTYSDGIENGSFSRCGCSHYDTGTCRYVDNTFRFVILFG